MAPSCFGTDIPSDLCPELETMSRMMGEKIMADYPNSGISAVFGNVSQKPVIAEFS